VYAGWAVAALERREPLMQLGADPRDSRLRGLPEPDLLAQRLTVRLRPRPRPCGAKGGLYRARLGPPNGVRQGLGRARDEL